MDVSLVASLLAVCVSLCCKSCETFLKQIDFERVKSRHESIDAQIVLETVNQMRVRHILRNDIAWFPFDFGLATNNLDTASTRGSTRLHDIHMLVIVSFTIHAKFAVVVWEEVRFGTVVVLGEGPLHALVILPHEVLAPNLERLRVVIDFLVLRRLFQVLRLRLPRPHHIPLGTVWADDSAAARFERVHHRVVNMGCIRYLKAHSHVVLLEVVLVGNLHLLERPQAAWLVPIEDL